MNKGFNIRVYGILINPQRQVLVADECRFNRSFTKFPGGGLHWGEGIKDCIQREMMEEIGLPCTIGDLFYVNDFFQVSAFNENDQLMSFYYLIENVDYKTIPVEKESTIRTTEGEQFRWIDLDEIDERTFTFPLDKVVAKKLSELKTK